VSVAKESGGWVGGRWGRKKKNNNMESGEVDETEYDSGSGRGMDFSDNVQTMVLKKGSGSVDLEDMATVTASAAGVSFTEEPQA